MDKGYTNTYRRDGHTRKVSPTCFAERRSVLAHPPLLTYSPVGTPSSVHTCRTLVSRWDAELLTEARHGAAAGLHPLSQYDLRHTREVLQDLVSTGGVLCVGCQLVL